SGAFGQSDSMNLKTIGIWGYGPCHAVDTMYYSGTYYTISGSGLYLRFTNVNTITAPTLAREIQLPSEPVDIYKNGNYVYVACGLAGVVILNVSSGLPTGITGTWPAPSGYSCDRLAASGGYIYVGSISAATWYVINATTPSSPVQLLANYWPTGQTQGIAIKDSFAYLARGSAAGDLMILNISNPASPVKRDSVIMTGSSYDVVVKDSFAYLESSDSLRIIKVKDPANPTWISAYKPYTSSSRISIKDSFLYLTEGAYGYEVVKVKTPTSPTQLYRNTVSGHCTNCLDIATDVNRAYVADYDGLELVGMSTPANPIWDSCVVNPSECQGMAYDGSVPNRLYVANAGAGLKIIDVSTLSSPTLLGETARPKNCLSVKLRVVGDTLAFLACSGSGLQVYNIKTASSITQVDSLGNGYAWYDLALSHHFSMSNDTLAFCAGANGLNIVKIKDPANITLLGNYPTMAYGAAVDASDTLAYVADTFGLRIINTKNPASPALLGQYAITGLAKKVAVKDSFAYVAGSNGFYIIKVKNPASPALVWSDETLGDTKWVTVDSSSNQACIGCMSNSKGMILYDISTPASPTVLGYYRGYTGTIGQAWKPGTTYIYQSFNTAGLRVMQYVDFTPPNTPTLLSPANGSKTNDTSPTRTWSNESASGGYRYRLYTARDSLFTTSVDSVTGINQYADSTTRATGLWYWRVRAADVSNNWSPYSSVWTFRIDTQVPPGPTSITANGSTGQSPWAKDSSFTISVTPPFDSSGIWRHLYKLHTAPTATFDTTASALNGSPFTVKTTRQSHDSLYIWEQDSAGCTSFGSRGFVVLRYDTISPGKVTVLQGDSANPSPWRSDSSFSIRFTAPFDSSAIARHYAKLGSAPTGLSDTNNIKSSTAPFIVYQGTQGSRWLHVWERDSAGNCGWTAAKHDSVKLRFDNVAPAKPSGIAVSPSGWTSTNSFTVTFAQPSEVSGVDRYFYKIGSSPTGPYDTTHALSIAYNGSLDTIAVSATTPGGQWCYVWMEDSAGNVSNGNRDSVLLKYDNSAPSVAVTAPTAGATWYCGTNQSIQWTQTDSGAFKRDSVIYSSNGGATWNFIWAGTPATSRIWTVPNTQSTNCLVRVYARDSVDLVGYGTSGTFTIADTTKPTAHITSPNGGESWPTGSFQTIAFTQSDNAGIKEDSVYYSTDGGTSWTHVFGGGVTSSIGFWLPSNVASDNCLAKVVVIDSSGNKTSDLSDSHFSIVDTTKPTGTVLSPTGGQTYYVSTPYQFHWNMSDNVGVTYVLLQYTKDNWASSSGLYNGAPIDTFTWSWPSAYRTSQCGIRVLLQDAAGNSSWIYSGLFTMADSTKPQVTVTVPNGGQTWYCGSQQNLYWTSSDNVGVAGDSVGYSTDDGSSWNFIATHAPDNGSMLWSVPNTPSTQCRIRVKAWDSTGNWRVDQSDANFTIADTVKPSMVTIVAPQPSDVWQLQSTHNIQWTQSDNVGVAFDSLLYSLDGGASWNYITKIAATTSYSWTLPNAFSRYAGIKVVAIDGSGNKAEVASGFTISDPSGPAVLLTAPSASGISWQALSSHLVTWEQNDNFGVVRDSLYYSTDGGSSWSPVWGDTANTSYIWSVPNPPSTTCKVKVVAYDGYGNRAEDASDNNFTITASSINITVTSPNGGQSYAPGDNTNVTWTQSANVTSDTLLISLDGGSTWSLIWGGAAATLVNWTVPNTPSNHCRIKVIAVENPGNVASDISDADFTIRDIDAPTVAVTSPNGGEQWPVGTSQNVTWTQGDNIGVAGDSLWLFDGGNLTLLYSGAPKTTHSWQVPMTPGSSYWIKVKAWDASGNSSSDQSDNSFGIVDTVSPTVQLNAPTGGEVLGIGSNFQINWNQSDNVGVAVDTLQYSSDGGTTWSLIWSGTGTQYSWTVPNSPSGNCLVRIIARDGSGNRAQSTSGAFT
ncbi:MAG TPA: hypothetical protein VMF29_05805, partial [Candidatus Edwardsbacteria bacterium]|nr:hypothetical protein [Candidatus Edwardsbacteria bacterium]